MTLETAHAPLTGEVGLDVFVPVHGHPDLTAQCIDALYRNTRTPFHLIIADDGDLKKDLTSVFMQGLAARYDNVTLIHKETPPGWKTGNEFFNAAFQHAQTDYIATVMNSVMVEPDWEVVPLQLLRNQPDVGIIGCKAIYRRDSPKPGLIESAGIQMNGFTPIDLGRDMLGHSLCGVNEVFACQWAMAVLRKQAVVGNLEEDVFFGHVGWDDIDNCLAIKRKGWKILYCGMSVGFHSPHATRGDDSLPAAVKNLYNSHQFYRRNGYWDLFLRTAPPEILKTQVEAMTRGAEKFTGADQKRILEDLAMLVGAIKAVGR